MGRLLTCIANPLHMMIHACAGGATARDAAIHTKHPALRERARVGVKKVEACCGVVTALHGV
jgi:hypothetical protein